jgi:hypothetical protein
MDFGVHQQGGAIETAFADTGINYGFDSLADGSKE